MKGTPQVLEVGDMVLVRKVTKGKEKVQGALWAYAAEIIAVNSSKYIYQLRWKTDGPLLLDKPGTTATRWYHQRSLKQFPANMTVADFAAGIAPLDSFAGDSFEVEAVL